MRLKKYASIFAPLQLKNLSAGRPGGMRGGAARLVPAGRAVNSKMPQPGCQPKRCRACHIFKTNEKRSLVCAQCHFDKSPENIYGVQPESRRAGGRATNYGISPEMAKDIRQLVPPILKMDRKLLN